MSTETKHTPGPWEHIPGSYFDRIQAYDGTVIVDAEIDVANARLIAAAPELMGALKAVQRIIGQDSATMSEQTAVLRQMRQAIAKAEGRQ